MKLESMVPQNNLVFIGNSLVSISQSVKKLNKRVINIDSFNDTDLVGENFIIKYESTGQAALELHHDSSDFTILTALNDDFEGGGTWFHNQKTLVKNPVGGATFHPGAITHLHGGRPVSSGVRYIIVSFCRCEND